MSEETARLTLAFIGEQEVHRNNSRALLDDMVDGWQRSAYQYCWPPLGGA